MPLASKLLKASYKVFLSSSILSRICALDGWGCKDGKISPIVSTVNLESSAHVFVVALYSYSSATSVPNKEL
jgi:hypothetical protein